MKELKAGVKNLINDELIRANEVKPLFASNHEAYAVILEELQEAKDEVEFSRMNLSMLWEHIKADSDDDMVADLLESIRMSMLLCACESIQTSAMCEKALISMAEPPKAETDEKWEQLKELFREFLGVDV